jgi:hypothetical protein
VKGFIDEFGDIPKKSPLALDTIAMRGATLLYLPKKERYEYECLERIL